MNLKIGDTFSTSKTIRDEDVRKFAELVGDFNPIHLDDEFAASTRFGKRIGHGMLTASLFSAVLGYNFPERRIVYLSQSLQFKAPVFLDDTITATAKIVKIREDKPVITLETVCTNQNGEAVLTGEAVVLLL